MGVFRVVRRHGHGKREVPRRFRVFKLRAARARPPAFLLGLHGALQRALLLEGQDLAGHSLGDHRGDRGGERGGGVRASAFVAAVEPGTPIASVRQRSDNRPALRGVKGDASAFASLGSSVSAANPAFTAKSPVPNGEDSIVSFTLEGE